MAHAVIVDAVRSPMGRGRAGGALSQVHPVDLLSQVLAALIERNFLDPSTVDDVVIGCVSQSAEQSGTPGRQAWLAAGFSTDVPSVTVERKCGSGQQAIDFATWGVIAGAYDVVIAGGVESMSRVPMGSARGDADPYGPQVRARFPDLVSQGVAAELVAHKWGLSRDALDSFSARSHARASAVRADGGFDSELVPITAKTDAGTVVIGSDETIRATTTTAGLSTLAPAFDSDANRVAHPEIDWKITAGSSSQITDGASALLIMSEGRASALGLTPRARIVASAIAGDDPRLMLTAPIPATCKVLERSRLRIEQMDAIEVNEAFASVPLAWQAELNADDAQLNPRGGAIALGHPLGASGARLMTSLINHLEQTGGRYGLQTMCEAGGMANATVIELI
jgi:acetyl-CoA acyltransferase